MAWKFFSSTGALQTDDVGTSGTASSATPENVLLEADATPGIAVPYSREDHVHGLDENTDFTVQSLTATGDLFATQFNGQLGLANEISATISASTDDWNPTGLSGASVIRANVTGTYNLTGIETFNMNVLILVNVGAGTLTLKHDATSTSTYRFYLPFNKDFPMPPQSSVILYYDNTSSRWRMLTTPLQKSDTNPTQVANSFVGVTAGSSSEVSRVDHQHEMPDAVTASVTKSATQSLSDNVSTKVTWNTVEFDALSFFDDANDRLTVPSGYDGMYMVVTNINFATDTSGFREVIIKKTGVNNTSSRVGGFASAGAGVSAVAIVSMVSTDYIEIYARQNTGGALNINTTSTFMIARLS